MISPSPEDDIPLLEGLDRVPPKSFELQRPPGGLREAILERTLRLVRQRARRRCVGVLSMAAALFALGISVGLGLPRSGRETERAESAPVDPSPGDLLRRVAEAPLAERVRLLKLAGDEYLAGGFEVARALDCYRQILEIGSEAELADVGKDNWLLASLKQERQSQNRR